MLSTPALVLLLVASGPQATTSSSPTSGTEVLRARASPAEPSAPDTATVKRWKLETGGYGPVGIGMSLVEASQALGRDLTPEPGQPANEEGCFYGRDLKEPVLKDVGFMFYDGRLTRIDVHGDQVRTSKGARVGTTEKELRRLYPGVKVEPHPYRDGGHYFIASKGGRGYVFETDGKRVTSFRAGDGNSIEWSEGCS